jgi:adenylate cyclase
LADLLSPEQLIHVLNEFFDCQVAAIDKHGGEILKFMGDGLLAIFRVPEFKAAPEICARAVSAADQAIAGLAALVPQRRYGIGLHSGRVMYGNIGAVGRLDFTCIGPPSIWHRDWKR